MFQVFNCGTYYGSFDSLENLVIFLDNCSSAFLSECFISFPSYYLGEFAFKVL